MNISKRGGENLNKKSNIEIIDKMIALNIIIIPVCIFLDFSSRDYICGLEGFFNAVVKYNTNLLGAFMSIWGAVISVTIFLAGKLDNLIYGISLRQIISWELKSARIYRISAVYCLMFPVMLISVLLSLPITQLALLIIIFFYVIFFAVFVIERMDNKNICTIIKQQSLSELEDILNTKNNNSAKPDYTLERLPICISINNIDYENEAERKYVLDVLTEIGMLIKNRMITNGECSDPQFHILLFPLIQKLITYSEMENSNKYRRTRILLCELLIRIVGSENQSQKTVQTKGCCREANILISFVIIAAAIYCYPKDSSENDINELLKSLPWELRPYIVFLLLAFIEYLYAGGDINSERLNSFAGHYIGDIYPIMDGDTYYSGRIPLYWHIWNKYNFGYWKEVNLYYLKDFLAEYNKIRAKNYFGKSYVINQIKYGERDTWRAF